jgi:hypothetical protein
VSAQSDKFNAAWEFADTADSKGSHTLTNNNTVTFASSIATFVAASEQSLHADDAADLSFAGADWFAQWRGTLTDKVTGLGQTIYAKDQGAFPTREQFLMYLVGDDRIVWDVRNQAGDAMVRLTIDESPPEDVEFTVQVWYDHTAGTGGLGRMFGRINLGPAVYEIDNPNAGVDTDELFRIGSLNDISDWYFNGLMQRLLVGTTLFTSEERDWMADKTWAQIETGPASAFNAAWARSANGVLIPA